MISRDKYFASLAENGKRDDGRKPDETRKIEVKTDVVEKAEGSALVKLGSTQVMTGIKLDVKEPFPDTPDEGVLMAGAEFSPIASPLFESGPPDENSVELARVVDRGIRESKVIDMNKLCIKKGEEVWVVSVDMFVLNNGGNMLDATALASIAALHSTRMPKLEDGKIIRGEYSGKLPISGKPVAVTHINVGNNLFVDPTYEEERIADTAITVTSMDNGNISSIQKRGSKGLTLKEIEEIFEKSIKRAKEMRKHI